MSDNLGIEEMMSELFGMESLASDKATVDSVLNKLHSSIKDDKLDKLSSNDLRDIASWLEELKLLRSNEKISKNEVSFRYLKEWREDNSKYTGVTPDGKKDSKSLVAFFQSKIYEEVTEAVQAFHDNDKDHTEDECGDVINTVMGLVMSMKVCPSAASFRGHDKLRRRIDVLKQGGNWSDAKNRHPR